MSLQYAAPCIFGLEGLAADELRGMEAQNVRAENGRVLFAGGQDILVRANLCSRFSERILILLGTFEARSFEELFQGVKRLDWPSFLGRKDAFPVKGYSLNSKLHSVPDCQKIIKKAVVESLKAHYHADWFEESGPVHQIRFSILKDRVSVMLDTSGAGLHKRGYRAVSNDAPLKETLAAALCSLSRLRHYHMLYDPFCGSGTILIEGAMLANHIAPGLGRSFACMDWQKIPESVWRRERERAQSLVKTDTDFIAFGSDADASAVALAGENAKKAGVEKFMRLSVQDIAGFSPSTECGTLVTNPPYGERMLDVQTAQNIYRTMGQKFPRRRGWSYGVISPDEQFESYFGRRADKTRKLYNGMIPCRYYMFFK